MRKREAALPFGILPVGFGEALSDG